ncbi:hypothetical protein L484_028003 [Morus notabilis]|uniref:Uncharacterized protein n=1 Tax=Morus notabilis TaxID=981085 RepID=W9SI95_9ROSA|nr:hypothetical protein L484_028003 [Morus notabilis]
MAKGPSKPLPTRSLDSLSFSSWDNEQLSTEGIITDKVNGTRQVERPSRPRPRPKDYIAQQIQTLRQ